MGESAAGTMRFSGAESEAVRGQNVLPARAAADGPVMGLKGRKGQMESTIMTMAAMAMARTRV
jgi:hypothetical protein